MENDFINIPDVFLNDRSMSFVTATVVVTFSNASVYLI